MDCRALVPGFGEVGFHDDDLVEHVEREGIVLLPHRIDRPRHQQVGGGAARAAEAAEDFLLDPFADRTRSVHAELRKEVVERKLGDDAVGEDRGVARLRARRACSQPAQQGKRQTSRLMPGKVDSVAFDVKTRKLGWSRNSALASLVALLRLVDDVDATLAPNQAVFAVAAPERP